MTAAAAPVRRMPRLGRCQIIGLLFGLARLCLVGYIAPNIEPADKAVTFEPPPEPASSRSIRARSSSRSASASSSPRSHALRAPRPHALAARAACSTASCFRSARRRARARLVGGPDTNIVQLFVESLRLGTPIALGAMAGLWCERSGVVNIAIEGMLLAGAGVGFTVYAVLGDAQDTGGSGSASPRRSLTGGLVGALHALVTVSFRVDQIISGVVINLLALGVTSFLRSQVVVPRGIHGHTHVGHLDPAALDIPVIGEQVFANKPIFFVMFVIVATTWFVLSRHPVGTARAVGRRASRTRRRPSASSDPDPLPGRDPRRAHRRPRRCVVLDGEPGGFQDNMTNGAGFIALAALIFGKWRPWSAFAGAMLFGFTRAFGAGCRSSV